ncbi:MAG: hypothetical protein DRJ07_20675, partial [Bacteroidetes bacterium]
MNNFSNKLLPGLQTYILPIGFFFFLSGILFFSSMSAYHTQIYLFLILPALVLTIFKFKELSPLLLSQSFQILIVLFTFIILSFLWNNIEVNDAKHLKQLLLILTFIVSLVFLDLNNKDIIHQILLIASIIYASMSVYSILDLYFIQHASINSRLIGAGNLSNPLLSSHIYGIFTVFIAGYYIVTPKTISKSILLAFIFISLLSFVLLTHSRTALVGLTSTFIFLLWLQRSRKAFYIAMIFFVIATIFITTNFENITSRGLSYRPELWVHTLEKISLHPILGFGIGSDLFIYIEGLDETFSEPHNIHLGLTYFLGSVGLLIWILFLASLFVFFIKNKNLPLVKIGGLMLLYGMMAGFTEGSTFFTRPKEIWFLTWLPISLLIIAEFNSKSSPKQSKFEKKTRRFKNR